MNRLRVAVVGCGHLGSIHARLLKSIEDVELVGVVDPLLAARQRVAAECLTTAFPDHETLLGRMDAAIIATPTAHHHEVAEQLLSNGVHVLIEKPITSTVAEANRLIALAHRQDLVLQVGHVERFNPAWNAVLPHLARPQYVEAVRAGTYTFRSTDVSIVLDLMIHDLDLVLSLADSPVAQVEAMGMALFGPHEDLALARLTFANGCVASLQASRVHYEPQRTMRVFGQQAFASLDFAKGEARLLRPSAAVLQGEVDLTHCPSEQRPQVQESMFRELLCLETLHVERTNAILQEQREFVASVQHGDAVRVTGQQGRDALAVAEQILESIRTHRWNSPLPNAIGPHALFQSARLQTKRAA
ncbi:MAG: Gfo/Idh/MocA family protein [Pirellulaceae bacterium]